MIEWFGSNTEPNQTKIQHPDVRIQNGTGTEGRWLDRGGISAGGDMVRILGQGRVHSARTASVQGMVEGGGWSRGEEGV